MRLNRKRKQGKSALHILHVGKTGGTAIRYALRRYQQTDRYVIYLHYHNFTLRDVSEGEEVIFFLRDPITRFVSGFLDRYHQSQPRYFAPWSKGEREAFKYFHTPNQLAMALSSEDASEKAMAENAMLSIKHVNFYSDWLENAEYLLVRLPDIFFIGFQETLTEDFEALKSKLDIPGTLKLPYDDVLAHKNIRDSDHNLEKAALDNLRNWYEQDYNLISQCMKIREYLMGTW